MQLSYFLFVFATMATLIFADVITDKRMCYGGGEEWDKNLEAAIQAADHWCIHDARHDYKPGQVAYRCENLLHDNKKVELWIQRTINGPAKLDMSSCMEMLKNQIFRCVHGGEGAGEGWYYR
jgi:hypothetical protein